MIKAVLLLASVGISLALPQYSRNNYDPQLARILRLENEIYPDGRYRYEYDTENGIDAGESGEQRPASNNNLGTVAQGFFSYTSPEGVPVALNYVADENGFHPSGSVLPTSPPVPDAIARSVAYNLAAEQSRTVNNYNRY